MSRYSITIFLLLFAIAGSAVGQSLAERHFERGGKFSINPPEDWVKVTPEKKGFKHFRSPDKSGFSATLNFTKAIGPMTLDDFMDRMAENMINEFRSVGLDAITYDGRVKFRTDEGLIGHKVTYTMNRGALNLISVQYFFIDDRNAKYIIAFMDLADKRAASMKLFDASVTTFKLEP